MSTITDGTVKFAVRKMGGGAVEYWIHSSFLRFL